MTISYNDKVYKIVGMKLVQGKPLAECFFLYKNKWVKVINYQIKRELAKMIGGKNAVIN